MMRRGRIREFPIVARSTERIFGGMGKQMPWRRKDLCNRVLDAEFAIPKEMEAVIRERRKKEELENGTGSSSSSSSPSQTPDIMRNSRTGAENTSNSQCSVVLEKAWKAMPQVQRQIYRSSSEVLNEWIGRFKTRRYDDLEWKKAISEFIDHILPDVSELKTVIITTIIFNIRKSLLLYSIKVLTMLYKADA